MLDVIAAAAPAAPTDMEAPDAQWFFTAFLSVPIVIGLLLGVREVRTGRGPLLFYCFVGGALAAFLEPLVDVGGLVYIAERGAPQVFELFGREMPPIAVLGYPWFVGGMAYVAYLVYSAGADLRRIAGLWGVFVVVNMVLEAPGVVFDIYAYYGKQPFDIWGQPLWWPVVQATVPIVAGAFVFCMRPHLHSARSQAAVIPAVFMSYPIVHVGTGFPMWAVLNDADLPWAASYAACLVTLGLTAYTLWLVSLSVSSGEPRPRPADARAREVVA